MALSTQDLQCGEASYYLVHHRSYYRSNVDKSKRKAEIHTATSPNICSTRRMTINCTCKIDHNLPNISLRMIDVFVE